MDPQTLKFTKTHEWVHVEGETATVGISAFAAEQLTDLVHLELPEVGRVFNAGEEFGEIESTKAVNDLYSPISGEIVAVNSGLVDDLAVLSDDPYGAGWMIRLKAADLEELSSLLDHTAYEAHCAEHDE